MKKSTQLIVLSVMIAAVMSVIPIAYYVNQPAQAMAMVPTVVSTLYEGQVSGTDFTVPVDWYDFDHGDFFLKTSGPVLWAVQASPDGSMWASGQIHREQVEEGVAVFQGVPVTGKYTRVGLYAEDPVTVTVKLVVR